MARGGKFAGLLLGVAAAGATEPPAVAPKPAATRVTGCDACRYLAVPRPKGRILPVQDGPTFESPEPTPQPLPLPQDATPLPDSESEATLDALLDRFLPDANAAERGAWAEELRHLPPELARDILAARSRTDFAPGQIGEPALPDAPGSHPGGETGSEASPLRVARRSPSTHDPNKATLAALAQAEGLLLHNIANADSIGFKRSRPVFIEAAAASGLAGLASRQVDTQGEIEETGRPLDLAIDGQGLFQVRHGDTIALTRSGTFSLNADGELIIEAAGGAWALSPPVRIPAEGTELTIQTNGVVGCRLADETSTTQIGQIELVRVPDPSRLESAGGGLLAVPEFASAAAGRPGSNGLGMVRQGTLERSNVDLSNELKSLSRLRKQIAALQSATSPMLAAPVATNPLRSAETEATPSY